MNANTETLPAAPATSHTKPLWAAVGILGIAVLAMGGGLIYTQTHPSQPAASTLAVENQPAPELVATSHSVAANEEVLTAPPSPPPLVSARPAPVKPKPAPVIMAHPPVVVAAIEPPPPPLVISQPAPRHVCANCGTIESVTPIQRKGEAKGVGAVAGGVLGAVVGNQIGHGGGRTAATVLGALGGGFAGNAIEKNVRKETVYQVHVRMEDGSTRTIEQANLPAVGARVVVEGNSLHSADGSWQAPATTSQQPVPRPQAQTQVLNRS